MRQRLDKAVPFGVLKIHWAAARNTSTYLGMNIVQFYVPGEASDAIKIHNAKSVAKVAGIEDRRLEYAYTRDGHGYRCRVTCSREMAQCLVEAFRLRAAVVDGVPPDVIGDCALAIAAALAALERELGAANS